MNNLKGILKKSIPYVISIVILLLVNMFVFSPQLAGKKYPSGDMVSYIAKTKEVKDYEEVTGEWCLWNPALFSGMPENLMLLGRDQNVLGKFKSAWKLYIDNPIGVFFQAGLICFLALCFLGINPWLALIGSLIFSLNTSHVVLFQAGHNTKVHVMSFFPLIISGALLCFKGDFLKGAAAIAVSTSLAILYNHIQMVYYLLFALVIIGLVYLVYSIKDKQFSSFAKGTGIAIAAAALAGLSNFSQLYSTKAFAVDTMRGTSILENNEGAEEQNSEEIVGLDWDYAMRWSNGANDVVATMIPRFSGGSSGERIKANSTAGKLMRKIGVTPDRKKIMRVPGYWGGLESTAGPTYMGITFIFLFLFSLFVVGPKMRWSMIGAVAILAFLSMGNNASWLNRPLFDHMPLFNKFRSPNSALMIAPVFLVISACLGLNKVFNSEDKKQYVKPLYYSIGILGGLSLFFALAGSSLFDFLKPNELQYDVQVQNILRDARSSMQKSDSLRSLLFVLLTGGVLWAYLTQKIKNMYLVLLGLGLFAFVDVFQIDSRYVKSQDYLKKSNYQAQFAPTQNDQLIFKNEPKGKGFYRVFDLSVNTFNDAKPSYHHHQIGGYDPAKLQRYQDVIMQYISRGNFNVLNMLNTKYIITQDGKLSPNPNAYGNAWFVRSIQTVTTPQEEIDALSTFGVDSTAIVLKSEFADQTIAAGNGIGQIELVDYKPNKLTYSSSSSSDQVAIFSEVWYGPNKGWVATIDGQEVEHFRANYLLRGLSVPKGDHEIVFEFKPTAPMGWVSLISSLLILVLAVGAIGYYFKNKETLDVESKSDA
ncbi:MAG: hypothetical protein P1U56_09830 [Saprospiraceae bacterium]|nr:hypothetical protein [Saprospiraceae bacterium]